MSTTTKVRPDDIAFTKVRAPYGWLGNMAPYPIVLDGFTWKTTEALFQALRFDDTSIRDLIRSQVSPMSAKIIAKQHADRRVVVPLSNLDLDNMRTCLRLKVEQHPSLVRALLDTKKANIIEDVSARSRKGSALFWGAAQVGDSWIGENKLGELWMERRRALQEIHEYDESIGRAPC
jgi:predicted NAD-dependent protein-ADP-ribosyltransferase YbiA (DUF1768 family)